MSGTKPFGLAAGVEIGEPCLGSKAAVHTWKWCTTIIIYPASGGFYLVQLSQEMPLAKSSFLFHASRLRNDGSCGGCPICGASHSEPNGSAPG